MLGMINLIIQLPNESILLILQYCLMIPYPHIFVITFMSYIWYVWLMLLMRWMVCWLPKKRELNFKKIKNPASWIARAVYPFITLEGEHIILLLAFVAVASAKQKSFGIHADGSRDIFMDLLRLAFWLRTWYAQGSLPQLYMGRDGVLVGTEIPKAANIEWPSLYGNVAAPKSSSPPWAQCLLHGRATG